ncbi:carboxypeptidase-like regulatory domain-containing protein [Flavobacterium wongokense]|uniref:carboxypeptidase-like regulatory domain-containing protein n=1 Tax=Flavobacterium wongokense TaxID=2910674 RepID=UPI001F3BE147|nr:carboxypeptidase-like regulatory domain-containing protein [Flavobacterium sp. WG47]MCF6131369.1 carboxypeptidase-like regulatory domain-containing protein [Flavobacterium sp. WG47]
MKKLFLLAFCLPLFISCESSDDDQIVCTQEFVYGLNVVVLDAATGQPLIEDVEVKATDGSYHEILHTNFGMEYTFLGAGERIGNYTVTVTKEGYQTYTSSPIAVPANVCHVVPQSLTVNLVSN